MDAEEGSEAEIGSDQPLDDDQVEKLRQALMNNRSSISFSNTAPSTGSESFDEDESVSSLKEAIASKAASSMESESFDEDESVSSLKEAIASKAASSMESESFDEDESVSSLKEAIADSASQHALNRDHPSSAVENASHALPDDFDGESVESNKSGSALESEAPIPGIREEDKQDEELPELLLENPLPVSEKSESGITPVQPSEPISQPAVTTEPSEQEESFITELPHVEETETLSSEPISEPREPDTLESSQPAIEEEECDEETPFPLPPLSLLTLPDPTAVNGPNMEDLSEKARTIEEKLGDFKVKGQIVDVIPGPVVTTFELDPAPGTKASKIVGLEEDLARSIMSPSVRVVGNVPGKTVIGIEIPNESRDTVFLREVLEADVFQKSSEKNPLTVALGSDITGKPVVANLAKMPHLLVAGTTGSGKSVALNAMICSILTHCRPSDVRLLMVDPKMLELSIYEDIPHLLAPVVTDVRKAANLLKWAVAEMEDRYRLMSELRVRNLAGYNARIEECLANGEVPTRKVKIGFDPETGQPVEQEEPIPLEKKPLILIIVDELADLMIQVKGDVEPAIARLAQMARAAGLHLILATQRPSVDVITGLIKANFPTRMSFKVFSKTDSRTILDKPGADSLLGLGDGLFLAPGTSHLQRIHAPFVSDDEVNRLVEFLHKTGKPDYDVKVLEGGSGDELAGGDDAALAGGVAGGGEDYDEFYDQAVALVIKTRKVSTSMVQRHFKIGYNRAARIIDCMEKDGLISEPNRTGKREVFTSGASAED
ncbi:MAG: cell division protein FtsK [Magnetococcales bacterium]|nr:cell division protein FtsK [Magnetococcales bacterium]